MQVDLETVLNDKIMARSDAGAAIARDFDLNAKLMLPSMADIERSTKAAEAPMHELLQEIEQLLALDKIGDLAKEGNRLNELLDRGAASIEERTILRRGTLFLRRAMYTEAEEWWLLNSPKDTTSSFYVLVQLLLAISCRLSGNEARAHALLAQIRPRLSASKRS